MSQSPCNRQSSNTDDSSEVENTTITDFDIEDLGIRLPCQKPPITVREIRIRKIAQTIMRDSAGITPTISVTSNILRDAAELLIDEGLLILKSDLFEESFDTDSDGYVKFVPDDIGLDYLSRLLRYDMLPMPWFRTITLPDVWKNRLSKSGIKFLRTMNFYCQLLDSPATQPSSIIEDIDHADDEQKENSCTIPDDELRKDLSYAYKLSTI